MLMAVGLVIVRFVSEGRDEAANELSLFVRIDPGFWVRREVEPRRHLSLANETGGLLSFGVVGVPRGDVEVRTRLPNVVLDQP